MIIRGAPNDTIHSKEAHPTHAEPRLTQSTTH